MSPLLRSIQLASLASLALPFVVLGLGVAPPAIAPPVDAPAANPTEFASPAAAGEPSPDRVVPPTFRGHDRFDDIRTVEELRELECEIVDVVERVRPSVVLLRGESARGGASSGTAVIIGKDGLLATCGHVGRSPGRNVTALLADGTELRGRTLGQCLEGDVDCGLVQLEVEGRELPAAALGTTVGLAKGDWLIAMGYTHGLSDEGRPSLVRVGRVVGVKDTALLFDAPIDAGDSGGPSFNLRGEVIGLNSRCGRESWQNLASPIDRLVERMELLRDQREPPGEPAEGQSVEAPNAPPDSEQSRPRRGSRFPSESGGEDKVAVQRAVPLNAVATRAQSAMVRVHCDDRPVALGLVIDANGLAVTKASQLEPGSPIAVETAGGAFHVAREVARDAATDVALLRFNVGRLAARATGRLETVVWDIDAPVAPGAVLITPRGLIGSEDGLALGFAAIERRESEPDRTDGPFLGVQTRPASLEERERVAVERAVTVVHVVPGAAAERAGLAPGDILVALDGTELDSPNQLRRVIGRHRVGDRLRLEAVGAKGALAIEITLGRRGDARETRRGNTATPISRRSSGFGSLLAHDTVTEPEQMGGPVVDLDGNVVGMNIARYDRTATHAIGADRMAETCRRLVEQSRKRPDAKAGAPAALRRIRAPGTVAAP